ncbi:hypothetical protein ACEPAH_3161 [Sanghuangporus vaninii]
MSSSLYVDEFVEATMHISVHRRYWLLTDPVDNDVLQCKAPPLNFKPTSSHDLGPKDLLDKWCELALVASNVSDVNNERLAYNGVKKIGDKRLVWSFKFHPVDQDGTFKSDTFAICFPKDHEMWKYMQAGDRLAVFCRARLSKSSSHGHSSKAGDGKADDTQFKNRFKGTVNRERTTRMSCIFDINGFRTTFDATLVPAMSPFISRNANLTCEDVEQLTGTFSYNGHIGVSDYEIQILDNKGNVIVTISGKLEEPHQVNKNHVRGTGVWMAV